MTLHPQAKAFLDDLILLEAPGWHELPPDTGREAFNELNDLFGTPVELARVEEITTESGIRMRIFSAQRPNLPVCLYFHGGGWVLGSIETHDALCRRLAAESGCAIVSVDYRLAPEHKFPLPLDDCYDAVEFVFEQAANLGLDPNRLAVAGDSAGANLAAAVALRARDQNGPQVQLQILIYPVIEPDFDSQSYNEFATGFGLSKDEMIWFWEQYLGQMANADNPLVSPSLAPDLSGLPTTHVVTAEYDVLRDEGEKYGHQLTASGVEVTQRRYEGQLHGFVHMSSVFDAGAEAISDLAAVLKSRL